MKSSFAPAKSKSFDDIILGQLRIGKNNWNIVRMVFCIVRSGGGLEAVGRRSGAGLLPLARGGRYHSERGLGPVDR